MSDPETPFDPALETLRQELGATPDNIELQAMVAEKMAERGAFLLGMAAKSFALNADAVAEVVRYYNQFPCLDPESFEEWEQRLRDALAAYEAARKDGAV